MAPDTPCDAPCAAAGGGGAAGGAAGPALAPASNLSPARPWFDEPCMMGIDEAGRGPVLGSMVYACVVAPTSYREALATKSYADSKTLTEGQRAALFTKVAADERLGYSHDVITAASISAQMLARSKVSLNEVAAQSTMGLIQRALDAGVRLAEVFIDTVGDADRYAARLSRAFPSLAFTVCPKADALYPVVSAASIVAKVTRDTSLLVDQAALPAAAQPHGGAGLGTGYPHDEATKAWLAASVDPVFGFHPIVRFSWETANRILEDRCVPMAWEADAPADLANQPKLTAFMAGPPAGGGGGAAPTSASSGAGRHAFFRVRRMQRVAAL